MLLFLLRLFILLKTVINFLLTLFQHKNRLFLVFLLKMLKNIKNNKHVNKFGFFNIFNKKSYFYFCTC